MLVYAVILTVGIMRVKGSEDECVPSLTTVNGKHVCSSKLIFNDIFTFIDKEKWRNSIHISDNDDDEFAVYTDNSTNYFSCQNRLCIQPTIISDETVLAGEINLERCTERYYSYSCRKSAFGYNILTPIQSAEIKSKYFSFKYGIVEIKAKLPEGDWIVPQLWLEPKYREYGPLLNSGRIIIAGAVGNQELVKDNGADIGSKLLQSSVGVGVGPKIYKASVKVYNKSSSWTDDFHVFRVVWKPDSIEFSVDGGNSKVVLPGINKQKPLVSNFRFTGDEISKIWGQGSPIAPFDKEFYIKLGVTVGGSRTFPDNCVTGFNHKKPWTSFEAKYMLRFWKDRINWHKTWKNGKSALIVDYVKVWSL